MVALLNRASTNHRLSILDRLVSDATSPLELVSERSLRLSLPEDDNLLRTFLAYEIETHGEAETLVRWALKLTSSNNFFCVFQLKADGAASSEVPTENLFELLLSRYVPELWERYGQDEIYISPNQAAADMQIELLFPELRSNEQAKEIDVVTNQIEAASIQGPSQLTHAASSSEEGSGFSQASILSGTSTAATSAPSVRSQSQASADPTKPTSTSSFKARTIPSTVKSRPSIEPRLSKAAALRMGVQLDSPARRTASPSKPVDAASVGISGVAKRPAALPASLRTPAIAPRLNKAAVARQGGTANGDSVTSVRRPVAAAEAARPSSASTSSSSSKAFPSTSTADAGASELAQRARKEVDFSNTPGHKRMSLGRSNIASIAPPSIAPRQNRASMSRIQGPSIGAVTSPRTTSAARPPPSAYHPSTAGRMRSSSLAAADAPQTSTSEGARERRPIDFAHVPGHKRASLSLNIPSLAAPSVAPRQNRASLARTRPSLSATPSPVPSPRNPTKPLPGTDAGAASGKENNNAAQLVHKQTDFATVPGHKRHSLSFALSSLKQPTIPPRMNKAAGARLGTGGKPSAS